MDNFRALAGYVAAQNHAARANGANLTAAIPTLSPTPQTSSPDVIEPRHERNYLADLGAGSSFLAGALGAGAGLAASVGSEHVALGLAAAAGIAGAVGGIGEFVDHLRERGKEEVVDPGLNDAAAATGALAGGLGAGAGIAAMIPGCGHVAIGLGVLAGLSGAIDGMMDVVDHRKNEHGFSGQAQSTRDLDSATNGLAGTLGAVASIAPAIPGGAAVAGVAAGIQGVAHIVHHLRHRDEDSATAPAGDGREDGEFARAAAAAAGPAAGTKHGLEVVA